MLYEVFNSLKEAHGVNEEDKKINREFYGSN